MSARRRETCAAGTLLLRGLPDSGTDTAWEGFAAGASECHGWSGTPVVALIRHVFRMDPRKGGRKRVRNVGGVKWMECEVRE